MAPGSSLSTYIALLAAAALLTAGCVRWYESYPEQLDGSVPRADAVEPPIPQPGTLNHAHDTCATAMVIDASTLPATGLLLTVDHSEAQLDHKTTCNPSQPELVLKLINLTPGAKITLLCNSGGLINYQFLNGVCPGGGNCQTSTCSNLSSSTLTLATTHYVLIARPTTSPTTTLTLLVQ